VSQSSSAWTVEDSGGLNSKASTVFSTAASSVNRVVLRGFAENEDGQGG
jgi:hypothetical protein